MTPEEVVPMPDPSEEEIASAMLEIDVLQILIDTASAARNSLCAMGLQG